jgi:Pentapeptide repeats (8 copies)
MSRSTSVRAPILTRLMDQFDETADTENKGGAASMSMPGQDVMDRIERNVAELIHDMNTTASSARTAWLGFMALLAFFVIALAGITHRDLLVETAVELPLLQVKIPQRSFLLFGPLILLLVHLGLLLQHVTLARKVGDVHQRLTKMEGNGMFRQHRLRTMVHAYTVTQAVAGPWRSAVLGFFLHAMNWVTLALLPLLVLLNFQVTFLPVHDAGATTLHRVYLIADVALLFTLGVLLCAPDRRFWGGLGAAVRGNPLNALGALAVALTAVFFSLCVATIPGETMDRATTAVWPANVPSNGAAGQPPRRAFWPTAALFEGATDDIQGRPDSIFSRNIVVVNTALVVPVTPEPEEPSLNLRGRDLKFASLDRTDMRRADLTGADLTGASLQQTGFIKARLSRAVLRGADLRNAQLISTFIRGADFEGARICAEQRGIFMLQGTANPEEVKGLVKEPCDKPR